MRREKRKTRRYRTRIEERRVKEDKVRGKG